MHQEFSKRGLQTAAVSIDNPKSQSRVKPFIRSSGYTFQVLLDSDMEIRRLFGGTTIPLTLLINRDGEIVYQHLGYIPGDEDKLAQAIEALLPAPADTTQADSAGSRK
jgi:peroxiredoxin